MIRSVITLVSLLALRGFALATCTSPDDVADMKAVRALAEQQCDCAGSLDSKTFLRCTGAVVAAAIADNRLNPVCALDVLKCAAKSTCGKGGRVACCRTNAAGRTKCSIKKSAAVCRAPARGTACVSAFASCCDACVDGGCAAGTTTTSSVPPPTTSSSTSTTLVITTTTSTTTPKCGNGSLDPGEQCDPPGSICSSAGGVFVTCRGDCVCSNAPTTTTVVVSTTSTTRVVNTTSTTVVATTTSTTVPRCGNGHLDPGEQCDPPGSVCSSAGGVFLTCRNDCSCSNAPTTTIVTTSTSTTKPKPTTTSTSSTSSTTSSTLPDLPCKDPILKLPPLTKLPLALQPGTANCGGAGLATPPSSPFSGEIDNASGQKISNLGLGCLYVGDGAAKSIAPAKLGDGAQTVLNVVGLRGAKILAGASDGTGKADCTHGAGPGRHCINGSAGTGGGNCTSDASCGGTPGSCALDANCFFGPPLPLSVPSVPSLNSCAVNVVLLDLCADLDIFTLETNVSAALQARVYLESCPQCVNFKCTSGKNAGNACRPVGSSKTTLDCPPSDASYQAAITAVATPLTTETRTLTADAAGKLCPAQVNAGAFGQPTARKLKTFGKRLRLLPLSTDINLSAPICAASTGNALVDNVAGIPGPAAITIPGQLDIIELLKLFGR